MSELKKQEETFNIKDQFFYYFSHWKWIALSVILCISLGVFYLLRTNNQYEIRTSVLIKEEDTGMSELAILDELGLTSGKNNIDNEIEVLKSADLMRSTVYATNSHITYYIENVFRKIKLYQNSPISLEMRNINLDTISGRIDFEISKESNHYIVKTNYRESKWERKVSTLPCRLNSPFGEIYISRTNTANFKKDIFVTIQNPEKLAVSLSGKIKIVPTSKKSSVLTLSINSQNIEIGKAFLQKLIDIYNSQTIEDKNEIAYNTGIFIDNRLKSLSVELSSVESDVEKFKTTNKITDISSEAKLFLDQTGTYEEKVKEVETQLNIISYVESFINDIKNKDRLIPNLGITDQGLAVLINKYNEFTLEKERIQRTSTVANPTLNNITSQLQNMYSAIRNSVVSIRKTLLIAKKDLDKEGNFTRSKIQQIPRIEKEFIEIKRQQQIKESLYLFLLQKKEETNLSLAATSPKAKMVSSPRSENTPASPNKRLVLLLSFLIGLLIPIFFIYIKDLFYTNIKNREELEKLSIAPVLGEIPKNKEKSEIVVGLNNTSSITELFRSMRNDITFILSDPDKKVITVTSTVSGEGKTFITTNLACTFAMIDKKVLLVGLDVRNPSLASYIGLEKKQGVTSYLAMGGDIDQLIEKSTLSPNLDIIQAGIIPPNPNELLNKKELDDLFLELRKRYDYILIDTAPVGIISDTFLVNRVSDITLYVTREGSTKKGSITYLNDLFENNRLTNLYVVLNDTDIDKKRYGYNYYYGYKNYGYRNKKETKNRKYSFSNMKNLISRK